MQSQNKKIFVPSCHVPSSSITSTSLHKDLKDWGVNEHGVKKYNFSIYATSLETNKSYESIKYNNSCAIVVGSENLGISKFWKKNADQLIKIPMLGLIDSLNVSVSAAITLFEVNRQNNFSR